LLKNIINIGNTRISVNKLGRMEDGAPARVGIQDKKKVERLESQRKEKANRRTRRVG